MKNHRYTATFFVILSFILGLSPVLLAGSSIPSTVPGVTIKNVHQVAQGVYRGSLPEKKIHELEAIGIKVIIALRPNNQKEKDELKSYNGIEFIEIPMRWKSLPSDYTFDRQIKEALGYIAYGMAYPEDGAVYLHCSLGEDRTGLVFGLYRMLYNGWSRQDAWNEMLSYGYKTGEKQWITRELTKVFNRWADDIEWCRITWDDILRDF